MKMNKIIKLFLMCLTIILICNCSLTPPPNTKVENQIDQALKNGIKGNKAIDKKQKSIAPPDFVAESITPKLSLDINKNTKIQEQRFDIAVKDVPAKDFFMGLVKDTKENIIVSPDITGIISLNLKNVTISEIMKTVRDVYGYEYEHTSSGYEVFAKQMETRMFTVNYLDIDRKGKSLTTISSGQITNTIKGPTSGTGTNNSPSTSSTSETSDLKPSSSVDTSSDTDFWKNLEKTLTAIIGSQKDASVVVNAQAGLIVVHAYPDDLRNIAKYLDSIQNVMQRQVIIEAQVLEIALGASFQSGVNWNILGFKQGVQPVLDIATGRMIEPQINDNLQDFNSIFTLDITSGDAFNTVIKLLNTQGKVNVLSSPRISTVNNQKAIIKVGEDQFFVTNVESQVADTSSNPLISQNIEFTPFFTGIALDVTPQIDKIGNVTLHIHPIISKVTEENKVFKVNGQEQDIPLAKSDVRESDSIVKAKNGQVVVIGGLMESRTNEFGAGTPGLENTPHFGALFKNTNKSAQKFELVILLRPVVVGAKTWTEELQKVSEENNSLQQQADFKYNAKLDLKND